MTEPEIYKRSDGLFDWRLRASNGQIIATSGGQGYTERNDAQEGADRVIEIMAHLDSNHPGLETPQETQAHIAEAHGYEMAYDLQTAEALRLLHQALHESPVEPLTGEPMPGDLT
jgi:uncharacterized protein YegP (UPF0339 family)